MFGSKSLNVPFIFNCDPRPPVYEHCPKNKYAFLDTVCASDHLSQKCIYVFDSTQDAEQTTGLMNPDSSPPLPPLSPYTDGKPSFQSRVPISTLYTEYCIRICGRIPSPYIDPSFTLHTSLFTTLPVFTQIAVMCKIAVQLKMLLFVSSPSPLGPRAFTPTSSNPKSHLNKVCIQNIYYFHLARFSWLITGRFH